MKFSKDRQYSSDNNNQPSDDESKGSGPNTNSIDDSGGKKRDASPTPTEGVPERPTEPSDAPATKKTKKCVRAPQNDNDGLNDAQRAAAATLAGNDPSRLLEILRILKPTSNLGTTPIANDQETPVARGGTLQKFIDANGKPYWRVRVTLADGTRRYLPERFTNELLAREYATEKAALVDAHGITSAMVTRPQVPLGETCDQYFERLLEARKAERIFRIDGERFAWRKWISPVIGQLPVATVSRDKIEDVRDNLDTAVRERMARGIGYGISGGNAQNVWGVLRTTFKEAVAARDRTLRVRADDPSAGHKPPLNTQTPSKTFIYPSEFLKLADCEIVPLEWRRVYAVAIYTYLRPEELQGIVWSDIDFDARTININKSINGRTGEAKGQLKTHAAIRDVPIEDTLLPLLTVLHTRRESDAAPVLPILRECTDHDRAEQLRNHLKFAGVTRPRLFARSLTMQQANFRSCRDSGITWLALKGLLLQAIQRRCGHVNITTTNGYVKMAEDIGGHVGTPFPTLPSRLL
jgi:integrase